jgi:hypothetical protein
VNHDSELGEELGRVASGQTDRAALARLTRLLGRSAKKAGAVGVASGRWMAELAIETAPRIPVRDLRTLQEHHAGLTGAALAGELIRNASRVSAGVGATAGAVMGAEELTPPAWIAIPVELLVETLAVAAVEMKLVAELHEVYQRPVTGTASERSAAIVRAWAERRGVTPSVLGRPGGLGEVMGRGARNELVRLVRRRMMARLGRNLSSLTPMFVGAVAGAEVNRRATRSLGEAVVRDLAVGRPARG